MMAIYFLLVTICFVVELPSSDEDEAELVTFLILEILLLVTEPVFDLSSAFLFLLALLG